MKHANAEMIKAVADNTNLVVLLKLRHEWTISNFEGLVSLNKSSFFPCLPKHKDAVLEKLNGGECQFLPLVDGDSEWKDSENHHFESWSDGWWYMDDRFDSRIKPKKEKRWIVVNYKLNVVSSNFCKSLEDARAYVSNHFAYPEDVQYIEIEVEV
tara:strand:+ start:55 stop:519 length:465 start_codon:yes stop_codon:yes gene_type:complete